MLVAKIIVSCIKKKQEKV